MSILVSQEISAGVNTTVFTATARTTINVNVCNEKNVPIFTTLYVLGSGMTTTANGKYDVRYVPALGGYQRTGIPLGSGDFVVINTQAVGISVTVEGA